MRFGMLVCLAAGGGACVSPGEGPARVEIVDAATAIAAAGRHTCAIRTDQSGACWGQDPGSPPEGAPTSSAYLPLPDDPIALAAGRAHDCALLEATGEVVCWGPNRDDILGVGLGTCEDPATCVAEPAPVDGLRGSLAVAAGGPDPLELEVGLPPATFSCAIDADRRVLCWGDNHAGQLGSDDATVRRTPAPVFSQDGFPVRQATALALGDRTSYALDQSGAIWQWGGGAFASRREDLPPAAAIAAGPRHACLASTTGQVVCWGWNGNGQADPDGALDCEDPSSCSVAPTVIEGIASAIAVTAGERHSCALTGGGVVVCWGSNQHLQLGTDTPDFDAPPAAVGLTHPVVAIAAGDAHTCALTDKGAIYCWGDDSAGQLGRPE